VAPHGRIGLGGDGVVAVVGGEAGAEREGVQLGGGWGVFKVTKREKVVKAIHYFGRGRKCPRVDPAILSVVQKIDISIEFRMPQ
jgi:hypothetical protein